MHAGLTGNIILGTKGSGTDLIYIINKQTNSK